MPRRAKPEPLPGSLTAADYASAVASQRVHVNRLADSLERGEPIEERDRMMLAAFARNGAASIPDKLPRRKGRPNSKVDPLVAALRYAFHICDGLGHTAAIDAVTGELGDAVDASTVRNAVNRFGDAAVRMIANAQ